MSADEVIAWVIRARSPESTWVT